MDNSITYDIGLPDGFMSFVESNKHQDVAKLRLRFHCDTRPWISDAITHIECLRKSGKKLGCLRPELMIAPLSVEQATSEAVARLHGRLASKAMPTGGSLLDMTCGMGIDLHAITEATGAWATGIELDARKAMAANFNFRTSKNIEIINADSIVWLTERDSTLPPFDMVFIDPARRDDTGAKVFNLHDCAPDVTQLLTLLRKHCRRAMIKLSPMLDVTQTLRDLPETTALHVVEEGSECRELLAEIDFTTSGAPRSPVVTIDICHTPETATTYTFSHEEERQNRMVFAPPSAGAYLFEPGPAAMKAKPFATLCTRHKIKALHSDTHLFTAEQPIDGLPGRWMKIEQIFPFSASTIKATGRTIGEADVAVRNFPMRADELQRRLKIKSGGIHRLIGTTVACGGNERVLILLKRNS